MKGPFYKIEGWSPDEFSFCRIATKIQNNGDGAWNAEKTRDEESPPTIREKDDGEDGENDRTGDDFEFGKIYFPKQLSRIISQRLADIMVRSENIRDGGSQEKDIYYFRCRADLQEEPGEGEDHQRNDAHREFQAPDIAGCILNGGEDRGEQTCQAGD